MQFYLNGAEAPLTDFARDDLARAVVNSLFSWARAEEAYTLTTSLAQKCGVGFFDVSGDGDIVLPDGSEID